MYVSANASTLKGGGHGKYYADFNGQIFSLDGVETHDTIFKIFGIVKVVK